MSLSRLKRKPKQNKIQLKSSVFALSTTLPYSQKLLDDSENALNLL